MFLNTLLSAASPIPFIAIGAVALVFVILTVLIVRMVRLKKRTKNLLRDNSNFVEIEAGRTKRELEKTLADYRKREHYNYASGAIPGAEPELRFLDPARTAAPQETVTVRQTYAPSMQIPKNERRAAPNPADMPAYAPKTVMPLNIPVAPPIAPPVLTPVPEVSPIMPTTLKTVAPIPPMPTPVSLPERAMPERAMPVSAPAKPQATKVRTVIVPAVQKQTVTVPVPAPVPAAPKPEPKPIPEPVISMEAPVEKITPTAEPIIDEHKVTINQIPVAFAAPLPKKQTKDEYSVLETASEPVEQLVIEPDMTEAIPEEPAIAEEPTVAEEPIAVEEPITEAPAEEAKEEALAVEEPKEEPKPTECAPVVVPVVLTAPEQEPATEPLAEEMDIPSVFDEQPTSPVVPEVKKPAPKSKPAPKAEPTPAPQNPFAPFGMPSFDYSAMPSWQPPENPAPAPEAQAPEAPASRAPIVVKVPDEIKEQYMLRAEDYE